jgi:cobalamin biosynthesis Co2+ chelatase CbiK
MIGHQTIGVNTPVIALTDIPQENKKFPPVFVILVNGFPTIATCCDMIKRARKLQA